MTPLKLVTFNLRLDTENDGAQAFGYRKSYVLARLREEAPDLVGFQEVLPHMLDWLRGSLDGYTVLGYGRGTDWGDESCPIAFRSDRFELQYFDQQWLSDRPFVPGSRFADQSGCPRVFAVCALRDRAKGGAGRFRFVNTHLDHEREYARAEGTRHIIAELARLGAQTALPYVITGDFNAEPGSEPLTIMAASGLRDLSAESGVTFHGYGRAKNRSKIDYIMAPAPVESRGTRVWSETRGGLFLSDHYPVETTLTGWGK